uniref:Uncharacterized protein n=1 Tax=Ralstonia syzygii R24 TaxID=907261 RepID=G3AAV4_9RALS|nr:hypothetical protein RALSY_mp30308 [Ralstonia syzygii R24]
MTRGSTGRPARPERPAHRRPLGFVPSPPRKPARAMTAPLPERAPIRTIKKFNFFAQRGCV